MKDSESHVIWYFVAFIILFAVLNGTVFYKQPSCSTPNINVLDFLPAFMLSFGIILTIFVLHEYYLLYKHLKKDKK